MGAAARKISHAQAPARPELRVVRSHARKPQRAHAASGTFRVVAVCMFVLVLAGAARVNLAARSAEAAINAWDLKGQVTAEKRVTKALEADKSSLAAPSRIQTVAGQTMNMSQPAQVAYLQLPAATPATPKAKLDNTASGARPASRGIVGTLMELAAGEAQVMLVGDVGLGSLR